MKVCGVVLAAGLGSRMGDLTLETPKPLLEVAGQPLIGHVIDKMIRAGVERIFINLFWLPDRIEAYLGLRNDPVPIVTRVQDRLNGPAGALATFRSDLTAFDRLLIASGDVLMADALDPLLARSAARSDTFTFACTRVRKASRYGVLEVADNGDLLSCVEKPDVPDDVVKLISAGVYCATPRILPFIPETKTFDYAKDLAPALLRAGKRVGTYPLQGEWRDVGTPACLEEARRTWPEAHPA